MNNIIKNISTSEIIKNPGIEKSYSIVRDYFGLKEGLFYDNFLNIYKWVVLPNQDKFKTIRTAQEFYKKYLRYKKNKNVAEF
jgi:hypothetical protein